MLGYVERVAMATGGKMIFVLSTQTMHWFVERGFNECALEDLPVERREVYDYERKSKIYAKLIGNERQLAANELFWSGGLDKKRFGLVSGGNPWGGGAFAESPPPGTAVLPKNLDLTSKKSRAAPAPLQDEAPGRPSPTGAPWSATCHVDVGDGRSRVAVSRSSLADGAPTFNTTKHRPTARNPSSKIWLRPQSLKLASENDQGISTRA